MASELSRRGLFRALAGTVDREPSRDEAEASAGRIIAAISEACVEPKGVTCRRCGEACEAGAIRYRPLGRGRSATLVESELCTGCRECAPVCPTSAIAFIAAERAALVAGLAELRSAP